VFRHKVSLSCYRKRKGEKGKGEEGKGEEGKGEEGKGEEGKGREGKGREGKFTQETSIPNVRGLSGTSGM
jgi:hypothetical protein